jgi:hypothetical protein
MVIIKVRENGPYRVDGDEHEVKLVDSKIGFKAAEAAVPGSEDKPAE